MTPKKTDLYNNLYYVIHKSIIASGIHILNL